MLLTQPDELSEANRRQVFQILVDHPELRRRQIGMMPEEFENRETDVLRQIADRMEVAPADRVKFLADVSRFLDSDIIYRSNQLLLFPTP